MCIAELEKRTNGPGQRSFEHTSFGSCPSVFMCSWGQNSGNITIDNGTVFVRMRRGEYGVLLNRPREPKDCIHIKGFNCVEK